jgi:hypothetical protein
LVSVKEAVRFDQCLLDKVFGVAGIAREINSRGVKGIHMGQRFLMEGICVSFASAKNHCQVFAPLSASNPGA